MLTALCHELEDISANRNRCSILQLVEKLFDKFVMTAIEFNTNDSTATSTYKFKRDTSRARKEVESRRSLAEIEISLQNIEEILLCKVCCRTSLEGTRNFEMSAFIFACDDSHVED